MAKGGGKKDFRTHFEPPVRQVDYKSVFKWEPILTLDRLKEVMEGCKEFAFDTETTGLDYYKLRLAGFSFSIDGNTGYYVPIAHKRDKNAPRECLDYIVEKICDDSIFVIMFNKKYDLNVLELCEGYDLGFRFNVKDAQALVWLRDTDWAMPSLKWASEHFLGVVQPTYGDVAGESTFDYAMVEDVLEYAALDAICTKRLVSNTFSKYPELRTIFDIDDRAIEATRKFEHDKIRLDMDWIKKEESGIIFKLRELERKIFNITGFEFNINSPMQTADALLRVGCILTQKTPTGKWAVNDDVISSLDHPIAKLLSDHSHATTYLGTFIKNLIGESDIEGKIRFNYKTCQVVTGRYSSGGDAKNSYYAALNAQNIPKPRQVEVAMVPCSTDEFITGWKHLPLEEVAELDEKGHVIGTKGEYKEFIVSETGTRTNGVRCSFLPDDDESVWVSIDYAGQELRIAANFSGEKTFVDAFLSGGDPHMETAKKIYGPEANKNHRRDAKGANFALQYGGTGYTLAQNMGITQDEGDAFYNSYCKAMPTLVSWQTYMKRTARRDGTVYSALGRPFRLKRFFGAGVTRRQQSYGERCALNYPIQGTGGDVIRLALGRVSNYYQAMKKAGYNGFTFKSTVHDEINFSVKNKFLHTFMKSVPSMMEMHFPEWKVPLLADVEIGPNWGESVAYKYDVDNRIYTPKGDYYDFRNQS
jgi:DNA polymerase-1